MNFTTEQLPSAIRRSIELYRAAQVRPLSEDEAVSYVNGMIVGMELASKDIEIVKNILNQYYAVYEEFH